MIRFVLSSLKFSLAYNMRFRQTLIGGFAASLFMLLFGFAQGYGNIVPKYITTYLGSWFAISCIVILSVISAPLIFFVNDMMPLLAFLDRFSRFRPLYFYVGLFITFLITSFVVCLESYFLGYLLSYILTGNIVIDYISNWIILIPSIIALAFIIYSFDIFLAALSRLGRGKPLIVLTNLSFLIIIAIANLQALGIISGNLVYLVPFSSIIMLLVQAAVGRPIKIPGFNINITGLNSILLIISTIVWSIILLLLSSILIKACKTFEK